MAKTKQDQDAADTANGSSANKEESVGGYFRRIFTENPAWLEGRSNEDVLKRWLADHPGEQEVPDRIKNILANVKSVLRNKLRQQQSDRPAAEKAVRRTTGQVKPSAKSAGSLEALEQGIDGCLMLARNLNREDLAEVITLLRQARNRVVWKLGE